MRARVATPALTLIRNRGPTFWLRAGAAAVRRSASADCASEPISSTASSSSIRTRCRPPIAEFGEIGGQHGLVGDLAQRDDRVLVAIAIDGELGAARNLARTVRREQHEIEAVGDLVDTIFDGYARHGGSVCCKRECPISRARLAAGRRSVNESGRPRRWRLQSSARLPPTGAMATSSMTAAMRRGGRASRSTATG